MLSKFSLSLITALALSSAAGRVAHAVPASMVDSQNDQINRAEAGNPDSIDYANRPTPSRSATNDEIIAAERGNPEFFEYPNRPAPSRSLTNDEINALERGNPHSIDYANRPLPHDDANTGSKLSESAVPDSDR